MAKTSALPNSYHIQPRPALLAALLNVSIGFQAWEYTHAPLGEQFETEGIRQVELDVFADPRGGLFARRGGLALIGEDPNSGIPELDQPGFRMMPVEDPAFGTGYVVRIPGGMPARCDPVNAPPACREAGLERLR